MNADVGVDAFPWGPGLNELLGCCVLVQTLRTMYSKIMRNKENRIRKKWIENF